MTPFYTVRSGLSLAMLSLLGLNGCASYYTHYAMFPAENSAGEPRQVRVSWQSAEYPQWWLVSNKATAILLETQCSDRSWRITDSSYDDAGDCAGDVRVCGEPGRDLVAATGRPATAQDVCLAVQAPQGLARVADIGAEFSLLVSCQPESATATRGEDTVNVDYLRPSSVPYSVYVRKVPRGTLSARLPSFSERVCLED